MGRIMVRGYLTQASHHNDSIKNRTDRLRADWLFPSDVPFDSLESLAPWARCLDFRIPGSEVGLGDNRSVINPESGVARGPCPCQPWHLAQDVKDEKSQDDMLVLCTPRELGCLE
jgi:hypothetical protein